MVATRFSVVVQLYLKNRQQKVVVGGEESETIPMIPGVPQGSVLGPLLFLIYTDGVTRIPLSEGSKLVLYADDMLLLAALWILISSKVTLMQSTTG